MTYITHLTKLVHKLCEFQIEKGRLDACFADLEEHYMPKFRAETRMSSLMSRYERCHQHFFQSYVSGIPGLNVSLFPFPYFNETLSRSHSQEFKSETDY